MSADTALRLVLCWHMHQPQYGDWLSREYKLPWSYLHAIKDYVDMAAHLEAEPRAKAVVASAKASQEGWPARRLRSRAPRLPQPSPVR